MVLHYVARVFVDRLLWFFLDTQRNECPINVDTFKIDYFMPNMLESHGNHIVVDSIPIPFYGCRLNCSLKPILMT